MIARAIEEGASDVHFEPQAKHLLVRARVDGVMRKLGVVPEGDAARGDVAAEDHG